MTEVLYSSRFVLKTVQSSLEQKPFSSLPSDKQEESAQSVERAKTAYEELCWFSPSLLKAALMAPACHLCSLHASFPTSCTCARSRLNAKVNHTLGATP